MFTLLHGMQTRSSEENSVRPTVIRASVFPSVKRVYCDKTEEKSAQIFLHHTKIQITQIKHLLFDLTSQ